MTTEQIVSIARESGLHKMVQVKHVVEKVYEIPSEKLAHFAQLVAEHEREACAKVCEEMIVSMDSGSDFSWASRSCAAAIRARGVK